jgi:ABC-type glycerol-3-phosphate transport system substrate-binding protein
MYRDKLLVWDRGPYALPVLAESRVCVYRADLLGDPADAAAPPASWEQFARVAEHFAAKWKAPSLPPLPARPEDLDAEFNTVAAAYARVGVPDEAVGRTGIGGEKAAELFSFHYDLQTLRPRLTSAGFVAALAWMQRVQKCRPPGAADDPSEAFKAGKAVLAVVGLDALARFRSADSAVRRAGMVGVTRVPGGEVAYSHDGTKVAPAGGPNAVPYLGAGGYLGVVRKSSAAPAAAWDLLAHVSGPAVSVEVLREPDWGGGPYRYSHTENARETWSGAYGLDRAQTDAMLDAVQRWPSPAIANPVVRLRTPDEREHLLALADGVREAVTKGGDPRAALAAVEKKWEAIDAKVDEKTRRGWYRLSLSLDR